MSAAQRRLVELVALLERARPGESLDALDESLEVLRAERRIEAALFSSASRVLRSHGVGADELPQFRPLQLDVGEALVLLVRDGAATTAILRALAGQPRNRALIQAPETALDAVVAFRRALGRSANRTLNHELSLVSRFEMDLLSAEPREVEGDSLGLAAVAAAVSLCLRRSPARDVACAAGVAADGALSPVTCLDEKLVALRSAWPEVHKIVVAESQPSPKVDTFELIRARTAVEAMALLGLRLGPRGSNSVIPGASLVALVVALLLAYRVGQQRRASARATAPAPAEAFARATSARSEANPSLTSPARASSSESESRSQASIARAPADAVDRSRGVERSIAANRIRRTSTIGATNRDAAPDAGAAPLATANRAPLLYP
jgi:hypothetical protein